MKKRLSLLFIFVAAFLVGMILFWNVSGSVAAPEQTPVVPENGQLVWTTTPAASIATVDGQPITGPASLPPGEYELVLSAPGYGPYTQTVRVESSHTTTIEGALVDDISPDIYLQASPMIISEGDTSNLTIYCADDGVGLASFHIDLDGKPLLERYHGGEKFYEYTLPLTGLTPGLHEVVSGVVDQAGNLADQSIWVEVMEKQVEVSAIVLPPPGEVVTATTTAQPVVSDSAVLSATTPAPVSAPGTTTITVLNNQIPVYQYTLAGSDNFPYPHPEGAIGSPQPQLFESVVLENDFLRLVFLPELGGRLYRIIDKATGEDLLYTNPAVKPTHWGPEEMNWWLAVGGMEWAFPVEEHGYAWGQVWQYETGTLTDGTGEITLSYVDQVTELQGTVTVQLPPVGKTFTVTLELANNGDTEQAGQMWFNAAFPAGSGMSLDFPSSQIKVHSTDDTTLQAGEIIAWQPEMAEWGRWNTWFGGFAAPATENSLLIRGTNELSLQRTFDPAAAPGVKFFTWGTAAPVEEWGGKPYFEVWGGLTADFDTFIKLNPGQSRNWTDIWTIRNK